MRRNFILVIGAPFVITLAACGLPRFQPHVAQLTNRELIERAEAIFVGSIQNVRAADQSRTPECLVLVRVEVEVENVLKGGVSGRDLEYFYFGPWCGTTGSVESPQPGSRSVFFLHRDQGRWRTLADYWRNRIPVLSGRHSDIAVKGNVRAAISDVLLTPGTEYSAQGLVQALKTDAVYTAIDLVGPEHTEELLQPLQTNHFREVRAAACVAMGEFFRRWDCAERVLSKFTIGEFDAVPPTLLGDLRVLARHAGVDSRTLLALTFAKSVASRPPIASPDLPLGLK